MHASRDSPSCGDDRKHEKHRAYTRCFSYAPPRKRQRAAALPRQHLKYSVAAAQKKVDIPGGSRISGTAPRAGGTQTFRYDNAPEGHRSTCAMILSVVEFSSATHGRFDGR